MAKAQRVDIDQINLQNAVKTLRANIRFASVDDPVRVIAVTSSVPNEGKTTVAISLTEAIATGGSTVLLVECDLRRRSVASTLSLHARSGLYSVLSGQVALMDAVVPTAVRGMYFLDAEPHIPNPDAILSSKRFRKMVETAAKSFDYVVFDTPPLSTFVDAAVLSTVADGTLLVVGQDVVRRNELTEAHEQLKKAGANVLGAVMNFCKSENSEYFSEYYTRGREDADAPSVPGAVPAPAPVQTPKTQAAARATARQAAAGAARAARPAVAPARGIRPAAGSAGKKLAPDSTAQFMASAKAGPKQG